MSLDMVKNLQLAFRLIKFDAKAADEFANTLPAARASFAVLWFIIPFSLATSYLAERIFIERYDVELGKYFGMRLALGLASLAISLAIIYQGTRWQGLGDKFPRWVISYNWLAVVMNVLMFPITLCIAFEWLGRDQLVTLGIIAYLFTLYVSWVHSWRMLGCNPFLAAGFGVIPMIIGGAISDFSNLRLYGVVRPFFDLP